MYDIKTFFDLLLPNSNSDILLGFWDKALKLDDNILSLETV